MESVSEKKEVLLKAVAVAGGTTVVYTSLFSFGSVAGLSGSGIMSGLAAFGFGSALFGIFMFAVAWFALSYFFYKILRLLF